MDSDDQIEDSPVHFAQATPTQSDNLMTSADNMKHPKKNHDNSLLKIHTKAHNHSKADKDIVIHAKKAQHGTHVLSQNEEIKVPQAMEPAGLM